MPARSRSKARLPARLLLALSLSLVPAFAQAQVRLKDIVTVEGVRENQLVGYGLVVGLDGTGDRLRNTPFTERSIAGMLDRLGVGTQSGEELRTRNVAAVMVTAMLPPFARRGAALDVVVSSIGDATSLRGGTLIVTPLAGADGKVYAVAQGPIAVAGFAVQGRNASTVEGVPTVARIENGATIEAEVPFEMNRMKSIRLALRVPDFTTAERIVASIDANLGAPAAQMLDSGAVEVAVPPGLSPARLIARIETLTVEPDTTAKVVIDARSGTIVMGANVRISTVAVSQGGLTVTIREEVAVNQPESFTFGETVITPETTIETVERPAQFSVLKSNVSLQELVDGLNAIGVTAPQTISILQAIKAAGALHADLEII